MSLSKEKIEIQNQWNNNPCGQVGDITYDLNYFLKVEKNRYVDYAPWMMDTYKYSDPKYAKKRLLEIGYGQGTDLVQYSMSGAICYGIDYTPKHVELAKLNFLLRGIDANLIQGDASALPYEENYFDKVVSFGALHHTPDIKNCISEVYRVLKPNGEFVLSLYHRNIIFYYIKKVLIDGILKLGFLRLGYKGVMATVEKGADGKNIKPLVNVYSKKELMKLLNQFNNLSFEVHHLNKEDFPFIGQLLPNKLREILGRHFGWYIVAKCYK